MRREFARFQPGEQVTSGQTVAVAGLAVITVGSVDVELLHLLERCTRASGIQIFIGEEAGFEGIGGYSVITAPYTDGANTLGVLGVIGPTRMAYERVIPIVDVTARVLSSAFSDPP